MSIGAKSPIGFGDSNTSRRISAPDHDRRFFVSAMRYGGRAWETLGSAGFLECRFANLRTAAPITVWRQRVRLLNSRSFNHGHSDYGISA
ncbi:MAG: hypothetical protein CL809_09990 [Cobetia sp.]|nr:hypothetical protein [Cobetia sp.]